MFKESKHCKRTRCFIQHSILINFLKHKYFYSFVAHVMPQTWAMTAQLAGGHCSISCCVSLAFSLLYGNEIHWGVKYSSGHIPISHLRSDETNASTVTDVAVSCLTWQQCLKTLQENTFSTKTGYPFKTWMHQSENVPSFQWDRFLYAHESITALVSIHPLNQTPRC